jgi:predicted nucleotidyltransferase
LQGILTAPCAPAVASAYLFGSVAEGRAHRESDVDVAVLLEWDAHATAVRRIDAGIRLAGALQSALGASIAFVSSFSMMREPPRPYSNIDRAGSPSAEEAMLLGVGEESARTSRALQRRMERAAVEPMGHDGGQRQLARVRSGRSPTASAARSRSATRILEEVDIFDDRI